MIARKHRSVASKHHAVEAGQSRDFRVESNSSLQPVGLHTEITCFPGLGAKTCPRALTCVPRQDQRPDTAHQLARPCTWRRRRNEVQWRRGQVADPGSEAGLRKSRHRTPVADCRPNIVSASERGVEALHQLGDLPVLETIKRFQFSGELEPGFSPSAKSQPTNGNHVLIPLEAARYWEQAWRIETLPRH
jgi:hypothetical protein